MGLPSFGLRARVGSGALCSLYDKPTITTSVNMEHLCMHGARLVAIVWTYAAMSCADRADHAAGAIAQSLPAAL